MRLSNCALWSIVLVGVASAGATQAAQTAPSRMRGQIQQSQGLKYEPQNVLSRRLQAAVVEGEEEDLDPILFDNVTFAATDDCRAARRLPEYAMSGMSDLLDDDWLSISAATEAYEPYLCEMSFSAPIAEDYFNLTLPRGQDQPCFTFLVSNNTQNGTAYFTRVEVNAEPLLDGVPFRELSAQSSLPRILKNSSLEVAVNTTFTYEPCHSNLLAASLMVTRCLITLSTGPPDNNGTVFELRSPMMVVLPASLSVADTAYLAHNASYDQLMSSAQRNTTANDTAADTTPTITFKPAVHTGLDTQRTMQAPVDGSVPNLLTLEYLDPRQAALIDSIRVDDIMVPFDISPVKGLQSVETGQDGATSVLSFELPLNESLSAPSIAGLTGREIEGQRYRVFDIVSKPRGPDVDMVLQTVAAVEGLNLTQQRDVWTDDVMYNFGALSANISCPPYCPTNTRIDKRSCQPLDDGMEGLYYFEPCEGAHIGPECMDPDFDGYCPFGEGDDCKPCPEGAVCPGGSRQWPKAGYYTDISYFENSTIFECDGPTKDRCLGWSPFVGRTACPDDIDVGSPLCGSCKDNLTTLARNHYECISCDDRWSSRPAIVLSCAAVILVLAIGLPVAMGQQIYSRTSATKAPETLQRMIALGAMCQVWPWYSGLVSVAWSVRYLPAWAQVEISDTARNVTNLLQLLTLNISTVDVICAGWFQFELQDGYLLTGFVTLLCALPLAVYAGPMVALSVLLPVFVLLSAPSALEQFDCVEIREQVSVWRADTGIGCAGKPGALAWITVLVIATLVVFAFINWLRCRRVPDRRELLSTHSGEQSPFWKHGNGGKPLALLYGWTSLLLNMWLLVDGLFLSDGARHGSGGAIAGFIFTVLLALASVGVPIWLLVCVYMRPQSVPQRGMRRAVAGFAVCSILSAVVVISVRAWTLTTGLPHL